MRKILNFGQKPWTNLLGKIDFLALLRTIPFWSKNHSFLSKISKTISSDLIIPKKPNEKRFDFWTKTMDYPLTIMSIFWHFLKRYFSGLEIFLFYPKYEKKSFLTWSFQKTQMKRNPIFGQKPWTKPLEKCRSWHFLTVQFSGQKNHFFLSTTSTNDLYWLVLSKKNK